MMKKLVCLCIIIITCIMLHTDDRGFKQHLKNLDASGKAGTQWLVVIGINTYHNLTPLHNAVSDAQEIKDLLLSRYYINNVVELYNEEATKENIIKLFIDLQHKVQVHDSLLLFYAGHGYLDDTSNTGFWLPVDAGENEYIQDNWIPNSQIKGFITNMKSRHVLLISDSCFSGDILNITRSLSPAIDNDYFANAYKRVSRQVLTSGALETVPDKSEFAHQLKLVLAGNTRPYLDPLAMFNEIRLGVKGTTPLFGELKETGHQLGASFLLFLKIDGETAADGTKDISLDEKLTLLDEKISHVEYTIETMENKYKRLQKAQFPVLINASILMGITGTTFISSFICLGVQYYNISLNQSAVISTDIERYGNYAVALQWARNGLWIGCGIFSIPAIVLYIIYAYTRKYPEKIDNNRFKLKQYRKDRERLLSFSLHVRDDTLNMAVSLLF